jgi:predicted Zn finger-like uncharacterized protein
MYTRCPDCASAHVVNAALLANARGAVRCGRCGRKFDALEQLFDEWPAPEDTPPPAGARYRPPVLGSKQDLPAPFGPAHVFSRHEKKPGAGWLAMTLLILLATLANLAWTFRAELEARPQVRALLTHLDLMAVQPEPPYRDPGQIKVISRDLHSHPTRAGMLVLSATFVNTAPRGQAWPELELTLLDLSGEALARRRFTPVEYLPGRGKVNALLSPQVHVPVLLEFASPGDHATGFEIKFH